MKKILLTTVAAAVLSSSSAYAIENMFYVKTNVGWSKLNKVHGLQSKNHVFFGVGAGYRLMDNVRVDLTLEHFANPDYKNGSKKIKGEINTLMLDGFIDLFDVDAAKVFVGASVGAGQVKAKKSGDLIAENNGTAKQKYNLAFAGYVGGSYEFTPDITSDITYSYRDMGKTKKLEVDSKTVHYRGHHVGVGVRFNI